MKNNMALPFYSLNSIILRRVLAMKFKSDDNCAGVLMEPITKIAEKQILIIKYI